MSRSSSPSEGVDLFAAVLSRGPVAAAVDGPALLAAMLAAEAALARAGASLGLVPADAAAGIVAACADPSAYDVAEIARDAAAAGNPVVPLVRAVERVAGPTAGSWVHLGATSQDVLDTALVMLARRAVDLLAADLAAAADAAARLATAHRDTPMAGRTLGQQAVPTTFGRVAAGWLLGLDGAGSRLGTAAAGLPAQLGGAAGTLGGYGEHGPAMVAAFAAELGLPAPVLPWHTVRLPVADLAGALGTTAGVVGKVALDVVLLAGTELGEVAEGTPGRGGSSAMPHKRNPVAAVSARAAALRAPGLVATLMVAMHQELERAAGGWQAEWETLTSLLRVTGSGAAWLADCLGGLRVHPDRMRANLAAGGSDWVAEALATAAAETLGRAGAHDRVRAALASTLPVPQAIAADPELSAAVAGVDLDALLDPAVAARPAGLLVDAALAHRAGPGVGPTPGQTPRP